jgi:hypothetical protein
VLLGLVFVGGFPVDFFAAEGGGLLLLLDATRSTLTT